MIHTPSDPTTPSSPQDDAQGVENAGVPMNEATARDFIQVRAALVRRLGNADDALVWTRIHWRTDNRHRETYEHDGHEWWAPSRGELAEEVGLSEGRVRRSLERLESGRYIVGEQHRRGGMYDRQKSYRCVVTEMAISPDREASPARSDRAISPDEERAISPDHPSIDTSQREETNTLPELLIPESGKSIEESFAKVWQAWPRGEAKKDAVAQYTRAVKRAGLELVEGRTLAWAVGAARRKEAGQFQPVPYLVRFLRDDRFYEEAPVLDPVEPAGYDRDGGNAAAIERTLALGARLDAEREQQTRQEIGR